MNGSGAEDSYVCTMDAASLKKAQEELHEDPKERMGAVETFRQWILEQRYLKCPTDTGYLLRFLRTAKFSQLKAREILTGYMSCKMQFPEWYNNADMTDPKMQAFLSSGYMMILPKRDAQGRTIILCNAGAFETSGKNYSKHDMFRGMFALYMDLLTSEDVQVNGILYLMDFSNFTMKHQTFWGMQTMKNSIKCFQGTFPARFKGFHYYNHGPVFEGIMIVCKPLLSRKFQDRINLHGSNLESVYKVVPKELLPTEYLPDDYTGPSAGSCKQIVDAMLKRVSSDEVRQRILAETSPEYGIDEALRPKPKDVPQESFRKLNID